MPELMSRLESLEANSIPEPNTGCWLWLGRVTGGRRGRPQYPICSEHGRKHYVSHLAIDVPPGMIACHRCDTPLCVNPGHLFVGTHADNRQDAVAKGRAFPWRDVCRYGHPMTGANLYVHPKSGTRHCRACATTRRKRYAKTQVDVPSGEPRV